MGGADRVRRYGRGLRALVRPEPVTGSRFVRTSTRRAITSASRRYERDAFGLRRDYDRLVASLTGQPLADETAKAPFRPTPGTARDHRAQAAQLRHGAVFLEALRLGEPLEAVTARYARASLQGNNHVPALAVTQGLQAHDSTRAAGLVGEAIIASARERYELAWARFVELPAALRNALAPVEYVRAGYLLGTDEARRQVTADLPEILKVLADSTSQLIAVAQLTVGVNEPEVAALAADAIDTRFGAEEQNEADTLAWRWLKPWIERMQAPEPVSVPSAGSLTFAMIDYKQPHYGNTSSNLGDYVQTLAATGHLLRHKNLSFEGDKDLVSVVETVHERVRPERVLDTPARTVNLVTLDRDASSFTDFPEQTWTIAFGWYMHDMFGLRFDFPFHKNVRPVFISFHVNRRSMLTPEAIAYLKQYGPIGCRDWNTVDLLLSAGVPAFFSGCLTTTTSTVFPDLPRGTVKGKETAYVDTPGPDGSIQIAQMDEQSRWDTMAHNLSRVVDLLERYRTEFDTIVTSRLHCFLPSWSIGANVDFRPKSRADVRFNGLMDTTDADRRAMRDRIVALLEPVTTALVEGKTEDEVYAAWREVTASHVAIARARHAEVPQIPPPSFDLRQGVRTVRGEQVTIERVKPAGDGAEVDVAFALDGNLKRELDVVVTSMIANSSRPLRLWILSRDHDESDFKRFALKFPEVTTNWLPCDHIDYGPIAGMLSHITVSTMDRLLLPDLLPELDKIVYHDIDALPLGDVSVLADFDLEGHPIAARSAVVRLVRSGFQTIHSSARRLKEDPSLANELLHRMYHRHAFDFVAFNAGILVLDLAQMRDEDFGRNFIPFVERFGLNDQVVLNCYAGARRAHLPHNWNSFPTQENVVDPKIIHWAGHAKPWRPGYVKFKELWAQYEALSAERDANSSAGSPVVVR